MKFRLPRTRRTQIIVITILVTGASALGWLTPVNNLLAAASRPFTWGSRALADTIGGWWDEDGQVSREDLEAEIARLRATENAEQLKFENQQLREQLNFAARTKLTFVGAQTLGKQSDSVRAAITINAGREAGIKPDMVVVSQGYLAGKVVEVGERRAEVLLIRDPAFRIQALTRRGRASGVVRGEVGATISLGSIIQTEQIEAGDTVITSGSAGKFPGGIPIGTVASVEPTAGTVFQTARLTPGANLDQLEFVLVITGGY